MQCNFQLTPHSHSHFIAKQFIFVAFYLHQHTYMRTYTHTYTYMLANERHFFTFRAHIIKFGFAYILYIYVHACICICIHKLYLLLFSPVLTAGMLLCCFFLNIYIFLFYLHYVCSTLYKCGHFMRFYCLIFFSFCFFFLLLFFLRVPVIISFALFTYLLLLFFFFSCLPLLVAAIAVVARTSVSPAAAAIALIRPVVHPTSAGHWSSVYENSTK